jgi:large subunit ribosomal protein L32
MAVPKRRQSKAKSASRRAQWAAGFKPPTIIGCPRCQAPKLPHRICAACGYYRDREVLEQREEA